VGRNDRRFNVAATLTNLGVWCLWLPHAVAGWAW
jgi:hypothetical protein